VSCTSHSCGTFSHTDSFHSYDALRAMKRDKRPAAGAGDNELMNVNGIPSENARDRGGSKKPKSRFENAVKRSKAGSSRGRGRGRS